MAFDEAYKRIAVRDTGTMVGITIDRPDQRNALDFATWDELDDITRRISDRDEVRVVTLTGAGDAFCAGVDFAAIGDSLGVERKQYPSFIRRWAGVADRFERLAQPTIAKINGPAIGAGFEIALACDLRIASDQAVFAMPQMRMGIVPDAGGTSRLARAAGETVAKDLILSCRPIDAEEALTYGIVSRVVSSEDLDDEVEELAIQIEDLPWPSAYLATVAIDSGPRLDPRRAADLEGIADQVMLRQDEVWERVERFMQDKGMKGSG